MSSTTDIPLDSNYKPVLALWDDATGQITPLHVASKITGADGKTYAVLDVSGKLGTPATDYGSNPAQTNASGADTLFKWGGAGTTTTYHQIIQNNTGAVAYFAYDQSSVTAGNKIFTLQDKQMAVFDKACTVLHVSTPAQQDFGGQSGITVEAWT